MLYGVLLCTMYMYSVWCTVYSVQCHSVHCTVCAHCTVQCVVSTVQCGKSKKKTLYKFGKFTWLRSSVLMIQVIIFLYNDLL